MVSVAVEGVLGLCNVESPGSKALVSTLVFRGSTIGLNLHASNGTVVRFGVVCRHVIGHGIGVWVGHGHGHSQAGQDNSDKCLAMKKKEKTRKTVLFSQFKRAALTKYFIVTLNGGASEAQ